MPLGTCASGWRHRPADPEAALLDCDAVRRWGQDLARLKTEDDAAAPVLRARTNGLPALDREGRRVLPPSFRPGAPPPPRVSEHLGINVRSPKYGAVGDGVHVSPPGLPSLVPLCHS